MEVERREICDFQREKVLEELVYGRRIAKELKNRLEKSIRNVDSISEDDLSEKLLESFTKALSLINGVSRPILMNHHRVLPYRLDSVSPKSDDFGCSSKKRRITGNSSVIIKREESSELMSDWHMWRKYGQKTIRNCKHPRSYYKCTYWEDKCEARKHVQQISDNPPVYRTTYFSRHTCKNPYKDSWSGMGYARAGAGGVDGDSSKIIRFDKCEDKEIGNREVRDGYVRDGRSSGEGYDPVEELSLSDLPMLDLGGLEFDYAENEIQQNAPFHDGQSPGEVYDPVEELWPLDLSMVDLGGHEFDFADSWVFGSVSENEIQQNAPFLGADE